MADCLQLYECHCCGFEWTSQVTGSQPDDCIQCGQRHVLPQLQQINDTVANDSDASDLLDNADEIPASDGSDVDVFES